MDNDNLLSVPELLNNGYALYRKNFSTLVSIGALLIGLMYLGFAAFLGSFTLLSVYAEYVGVYGFLLLSVVAIAIVVLVLWLLLRLLLAMFYTIRNEDRHLSLKEAFARSRGRAREFLWVLVLLILVNVGAFVFMLFLDGVIIFPFAFVTSNLLILTAEMIVWVASCLVLLAVASWLVFAPWFFVDKGARSLHALTLSKHLSHHHLGAVMWRLFCIVFIYALCTFATSFVLSFLLSFLSPVGGALTAILITVMIAALIYKPLVYCALFALYKNVDEHHVIDTESRAHGEHQGVLIALATLGFLALCALPSLLSMRTDQMMYGSQSYGSGQTQMMHMYTAPMYRAY